MSKWSAACLFESNNVKTHEPIGPKFCVGPHLTPGRVINNQNLKKFASNKIGFLKILIFFLVLFYNVSKEKIFTIEQEDGTKRP